jgi:hypothetical protein
VISFRPDTDNRTTRVRVVVPDAVQEALETTYRDQTVGELPYVDQADADALVSLFRTHANRRGLKLHWEYAAAPDGGRLLRFKMRDKRVYTKRSPRWHQASA